MCVCVCVDAPSRECSSSSSLSLQLGLPLFLLQYSDKGRVLSCSTGGSFSGISFRLTLLLYSDDLVILMMALISHLDFYK